MQKRNSQVFVLVFLATLNTSDFRERVEFSLPFFQATAFMAMTVSHSLQIARWFKSKVEK